MTYKLRPYQEEAVNAVWDHIRKRDDNPCVVLPTGCGKSIVIAEIARQAVENWDGRVLVLAHVKELLEQNASKIKSLLPGVKVGIYSSGLNKRDTENRIIVAGIQSVYKRACELGPFDICIIDEIHMVPAEGEGRYRTFLADMKMVCPHMRVIGMTATPYRLHGGLICRPENVMNHICYEAGIREMIAKGYLSMIRSVSGSSVPDLSDISVKCGEFDSEELEKKMANERVVECACKEIVELAKDRKSVIIFGCSVKHCKMIKENIEKFSGDECAIVTGDTPPDERAEILSRIRGESIRTGLFSEEKKPLKYLCNVNVLTTGFDAPNIDCIAMMRATMSPGLLVQIVGRGLRIAEGKKDCIFLDYGDNIIRHGPIDSIHVTEKKRTARKDEQQNQPMAKKCPKCHAVIELCRSICPECGHEFIKELNHGMTSSGEVILSDQAEEKTESVIGIRYIPWKKKGAEDGYPQSLCVEYEVGLNRFVREWICPEHSGYARRKFEKWWEERKVVPFDPVPETACEASLMASRMIIKVPSAIKVKKIPGERFDRITGYEFNDTDVMPHRIADECAETEYSDLDCEDDVPF